MIDYKKLSLDVLKELRSIQNEWDWNLTGVYLPPEPDIGMMLGSAEDVDHVPVPEEVLSTLTDLFCNALFNHIDLDKVRLSESEECKTLLGEVNKSVAGVIFDGGCPLMIATNLNGKLMRIRKLGFKMKNFKLVGDNVTCEFEIETIAI